MKISEYIVVIYNFQMGIANCSILVKKHCFIVGWLVLRLDGALQSQRLFAPVNFVYSFGVGFGNQAHERLSLVK